MENLTRENTKNIKTISQALSVLNDAASNSAEEIRGLVRSDFQNLKRILVDAKPEVKQKMDELRQVAGESVSRAREKAASSAKSVDNSVHNNAWSYIGGVAAISAALGFFLGRKLNSNNNTGVSDESIH